MTLKQAILIAKIDYKEGISSAIDKLSELGYNVDYYYDYLREHEDSALNNFDDINIDARNACFEKNGIYEIMLKAYNIIWD